MEARAEGEWATPESITVPEIKFDSPSAVEIRISSKKVNRNSLGQKLRAAAGPSSHDQSRVIETQGNPHWAQDTSGQWVHEFGTRAAEAIGEAINRTTEGLSAEGVDLPRITEDMIRRCPGT